MLSSKTACSCSSIKVSINVFLLVESYSLAKYCVWLLEWETLQSETGFSSFNSNKKIFKTTVSISFVDESIHKSLKINCFSKLFSWDKFASENFLHQNRHKMQKFAFSENQTFSFVKLLAAMHPSKYQSAIFPLCKVIEMPNTAFGCPQQKHVWRNLTKNARLFV